MMINNNEIKQITCLGAGVIGSAWAARFIENGFDVTVYDPSPAIQDVVASVVANADHAFSRLYASAPRRKKGRLSFAPTLADAVRHADLIVESVPERLEIKHQTYAEIEKAGNNSAIICASTSGLKPSDLQSAMKHPERLLVAHPFNPVYLIPVVEIVGGQSTDISFITRAMHFYDNLGMKPVHIKKEIDAFVADRLLEALWREALWLIKDGICTTEALDDIIRFGFGLRFAQMGIFETYRLAGGEAGMRHFMAQFGPCLSWPWTKLTDVPELDDALVDLIADQSDAQSGNYALRDLERIRDNNLVAIQQAMRGFRWGAGDLLACHEARLLNEAGNTTAENNLYAPEPIKTYSGQVRSDWVDYNNHMNETHYLECFCASSDVFLRLIGVDEAYLKATGSYFTVETHIRHLKEVRVGVGLYATLQLINGEGKKLHIFQRLYDQDDHLLATCEQMLIHVSLDTRQAALPGDAVTHRLKKIQVAHSALSQPEGMGRAVGERL